MTGRTGGGSGRGGRRVPAVVLWLALWLLNGYDLLLVI